MFLVVEGIDGSGKSELIQKLDAVISIHNKVVLTREPGGTDIGNKIREVLLSEKEAANINLKCENLLLNACRAQLVHEVIKPAINRGDFLISDRYFYSTVAYQGYGKGMNIPELLTVIDIATDGVNPDIVFYLDVDPEIAHERKMKQKNHTMDRFDNLDIAFMKRVRSGYLEMAKYYKNFIVIDANQDANTVFSNAFSQLYLTGTIFKEETPPFRIFRP